MQVDGRYTEYDRGIHPNRGDMQKVSEYLVLLLAGMISRDSYLGLLVGSKIYD